MLVHGEDTQLCHSSLSYNSNGDAMSGRRKIILPEEHIAAATFCNLLASPNDLLAFNVYCLYAQCLTWFSKVHLCVRTAAAALTAQ